MDTWYAYLAGFWDGEGSVSIVRNRANGLSDYHKVIVTLSQRAKHRDVLDQVAHEFGGMVSIRQQPTRIVQAWAEQAVWQLQDKAGIARFLTAIQPHLRIKGRQAALALEFIATFQKAPSLRDALGRIHGRTLSVEEIERRERLRLAMRELNELGPPRVKPSTLPPLDLQHRDRSAVAAIANAATVERGTQRYNARLTDEAVRAIRAEYAAGGVSQSTLAAKYGVSLMLINGVVRGTRWRHVT